MCYFLKMIVASFKLAVHDPSMVHFVRRLCGIQGVAESVLSESFVYSVSWSNTLLVQG